MIKNNSKNFYNNLDKEIINCPVCESINYSELHNNDRYEMGVKTVICKQCSLIYINPRPTEEEMNKFYRFHYREFYEGVEIPTQEYINNGPFIPRAEFVIDTLNEYLLKSTSFIDVGCAEGTLLKKLEAKYPNIKTTGIEPSESFGNYAKENVRGEVFIGSYQKFIKETHNQKFDVLTTTHVLEHILDPKNYLIGLKEMMHQESVLYIEVPNIMDERAKGSGNIHIGHVLSLDPITLKILLEKCGFEVISLFTENLPAKTPAMAVICKMSNNNSTEIFPSENVIKQKKEFFINQIVNKGVKTRVNKNRKTIYSRLKIFFSK
jgi:2-polyprenyl-3-methyl-5-hydroxy-6-metoxy-1,4-benzoquinol methylase